MKNLYVSWEEFGRMIDKLSEQIEGTFDGVYGVPRGGIIIALCLSHKLTFLFCYTQQKIV